MEAKNDKHNYESFGVGYSVYQTTVPDKFKNRKKYVPKNSNILTAFIPGTVIEVFVKEGDVVNKGQVLLILEAMKMRNKLVAPADGLTVKKITVNTGETVVNKQVLIELA